MVVLSGMISRVSELEQKLFRLFNNRMKCRLLDGLFKNVTHTGGASVTILATVSAVAAGLATHQQMITEFGLRAAASLSGSFAVAQVVKRLVNRPRPALKLPDIRVFDVPICAYSFPSGHTTASFAIAMTFAFCYPMLAMPSLAWAGSVGLSRIYLGVHYPSDVLAGSIIGAGVAFLAQGI